MEHHRQENRRKSKFLFRLAWTIEIILVLSGLAIAVAQALSLDITTNIPSAVAIFGVFVILAVAELSKIPAAGAVYNMRGAWKLFPLLALLVVSLISFETIFNGFERYVHLSTAPVRAAQVELDNLRSERDSLLEVALGTETSLEGVAAIDRERLAQHEAALVAAQAAYDSALEAGDSLETQAIRRQRDELVAQRDAAGEQAAAEWDQESRWLYERMNSDGVDEGTKTQLNSLMRAMPSRQTAINRATEPFNARIAEIQERLEASLGEPSSAVVEQIAAAAKALEAARSELATVRAEVAANDRDRLAHERARQEAAAARSAAIEEFESRIGAAERAVAEAASGSQMHRWASFVFRIPPETVGDEDARQVGAVFGAILAFAAALAGSVTAIFSEWYRARGAEPVRVEVPVEVPIEVEKRVEVEVEKPVEVTRYVYVPVLPDNTLPEEVERVLANAPDAVAEDIRRHMHGAESVVKLRTSGGHDVA